MNELADEYEGRVKFVRYQLMNFVFFVTSQELRDTYDINLYPTVVLVVDGQERKKWIANYNKDIYREALNEALGISTTQPTTQPTTQNTKEGEWVAKKDSSADDLTPPGAVSAAQAK